MNGRQHLDKEARTRLLPVLAAGALVSVGVARGF